MMRNLADIIRRNARLYPKKTGVITEEEGSFTFEELHERTSRLANALLERGVKKGDRVAIYMGNSLPYYEIPFICGKGGFIQVTVNERLAGPEVSYILNDCKAKVLITRREFIPAVEKIKSEVSPELFIVADEPVPDGYLSYNELIKEGLPADPAVETSENDSILILYTSGTTGRPKGADISHHAYLANGINYLMEIVDHEPDGVFLAVAPLYHSFQTTCMGFVMRGCTVIVARFESEKFMQLVERYKVNQTFLAPTMVRLVLEHPNLDKYDLSSLKLCLYASSPMPEALLRKALEKFGPIFVHMYGMSENCNLCTALYKNEHVVDGPPEVTRRLRSCGKEIVLARVRVVNESGLDVQGDEPGEIIVRDESLFKGYWNNPEATAEVYRDGWFYTGDIATVDEDGYIYIIDRKKDMIISGGSNVYPREVEEVLFAHPDIQDACVIGVPHEIWGEAVKAVVVCRPGKSITEEELIAYCREHVAGYKVPKSVDFVESLPRDGHGKLDRRAVRAKYWEGRDSQII